jgi:predicted DNA-binding transcriptional regulator AlpA
MNGGKAVCELLDRRALQAKLKISLRTIDRMIKDGQLPQPIRLGKRALRWPSSEINQWIEEGCPTQGTEK